MRKLWSFMLASLCIGLAVAGLWASCHPARDIFLRYEKVKYGEPVDILPYTVTLMALDLLRKNADPDEVRDYIEWHIDHLNYPDKFELTGTIYDYEVDQRGNERSLDTYDSVDSYSAMFLLLVYRYYGATGDDELVEANRTKLEDIAYTVVVLRDTDGLTWALPTREAKYLMDNCEAYGGLHAFSRLARERNWAIADYYEDVASEIKDAIIARLYDEESRLFYWALDESPYKSDWKRFYPDAYAQLFPILHGVLRDDPALKKHLWKTFHEHHAETVKTAPVEQRIVYELTKESLVK